MKVISIDAETNGLYGSPFSIAAIIYQDGIEIDKICLRVPDTFVDNPWVIENVLPEMKEIKVTHEFLSGMLKAFAEWWKENKEGATCICHMGTPVEAGLFILLNNMNMIGDFDGPFPLIDISGNLDQVGEDPKSVDSYSKKHNLKISNYGSTHNPLYDCEVAARVYFHLKQKTS